MYYSKRRSDTMAQIERLQSSQAQEISLNNVDHFETEALLAAQRAGLKIMWSLRKQNDDEAGVDLDRFLQNEIDYELMSMRVNVLGLEIEKRNRKEALTATVPEPIEVLPTSQRHDRPMPDDSIAATNLSSTITIGTTSEHRTTT
jgi:hypothetical protein